ncbi:MAG: putative pterin-4-alpha-carbinolamine dehydratase [Gammaproteobacteria bacterium]|jgi:4a-hydroxytetrahydrobiopterin dehydratase|nr:putative pterin-4-alpha-carbinolamine dehydratase [Gammaproteobacteria bacterium]MCE3238347.1 putative pterin-4-alpha-carbinolamine dehydratase [Gammaproteobacteria bacterium]
MTELKNKRCLPCESGIKPLERKDMNQWLSQLSQWTLNSEATELNRRFTFKNFYHTMAFVNAIAWIAHQENHHPDMEIGYNYCFIKYSTHVIGGLSENDFICAAKVDRLSSSDT